jgi:hypothetical protein
MDPGCGCPADTTTCGYARNAWAGQHGREGQKAGGANVFEALAQCSFTLNLWPCPAHNRGGDAGFLHAPLGFLPLPVQLRWLLLVLPLLFFLLLLVGSLFLGLLDSLFPLSSHLLILQNSSGSTRIELRKCEQDGHSIHVQTHAHTYPTETITDT